MKVRMLLPFIGFFALGACAEPRSLPGSKIYILVDLSETWHNEASRDRNLRVLSEVGQGTAEAARQLSEQTSRPVSIEIRIIGSDSFGREPVCAVLYENRLINMTTAEVDRVNNPQRLAEYLGTDCPQQLLSLPPEGRTEISNALLSVENEPRVQVQDLKLVILSDFLEEASSPAAPQDFAGFSALLVHRPLMADQDQPSAMGARTAFWSAAMRKAGASVEVTPDTSIRREDVAFYLLRPTNESPSLPESSPQ